MTVLDNFTLLSENLTTADNQQERIEMAKHGIDSETSINELVSIMKSCTTAGQHFSEAVSLEELGDKPMEPGKSYPVGTKDRRLGDVAFYEDVVKTAEAELLSRHN